MPRFDMRLPGRDRSGSEEPHGSHAEGPVTVTGRYRRPPGGWLIAAALLVPLVLALLGLLWDGGTPAADNQDQPTAAQAASPAPQTEPVGDSIRVLTEGERRTVTARVRDNAAKQALLDGVKASSDGFKVVDEIDVDPAADAPPVAGIGTILAAGHSINDLGVLVDRTSLTLTGKAADQAAGTSTVFNAGQSYPGVRLVDQLQLPAAAPAAAAVPLTPECDQVRQNVAAALQQTPVKFSLGGATVDPTSAAQIAEYGKQMSQCRFNAVEVAGHTDASGSASFNEKLSQQRAEAVAKVLVESGVPAELVTAKGYGQSKPVADNATDQGRAANRRVEINAS